MYNNERNIDLNDYFIINNRMMPYRYMDLVSGSGVIKYKYFPLTIILNDKYRFVDNEYLENLLLCDDVKGYDKGVIVDFSEMECSLIMTMLDKIERLYLDGNLEHVEFRFKYNRYLNNTSETYGMVFCDYKTIKETISVIEMITNYVKHFNLSEFEKIMFVYDLLKERTYKESKDDSKDKVLSEVLFNDAIVCLGYTNIMTAVLRNLGIDAKICNVLSKNSRDGHSVVVVNINDNKYDCKDRRLFFDVTVDNKQIEDGWENSYNGFGLCNKQLDYLEKNYNFDCSKLKENVDSDYLDVDLKKKLLANVRYIEHSIDSFKYGEVYAGNRFDFTNDNYLDYDKEFDASLLSTLRKILSLKKDGKIDDNVYLMLEEFLEENPEYIKLFSDGLNNISGNYMDDTDYTKNPIMPENNRGFRR